MLWDSLYLCQNYFIMTKPTRSKGKGSGSDSFADKQNEKKATNLKGKTKSADSTKNKVAPATNTKSSCQSQKKDPDFKPKENKPRVNYSKKTASFSDDSKSSNSGTRKETTFKPKEEKPRSTFSKNRPVTDNESISPYQSEKTKSEFKTKEDRPRFGRRPFSEKSEDSSPKKYSEGKMTKSKSTKDWAVTKKFQPKPSIATNESKKRSNTDVSGTIRLNKYIANAGVCSRREADEIILSGAVSVNGQVVKELGSKVNPNDKVQVGGDTLKSEKFRYVLLNKPKDYITTTKDPQGRKTVMNLVADACRERIYPVGRLDRNTIGLLLFTNDGELADKLSHPSRKIRKIYHVELDKKLSQEDFEKIRSGIQLDEGTVIVDDLAYVGEGKDKKQIGIEIHQGWNRIVRRIFESLDYKVVKLDRVMFAGLTKKDIPRGRWRLLTEKEISFLKMLK